jgi:uncharacterized protein YgiM (DUF1202 family)
MTPTATAAVITPTATATSAPTAEAKAQFTVNSGTINVRQGPGTGYPVVGQLSQGETYDITGKDAGGTWWQFNYNGDPAWVTNDLVTVNDAAAGVNVASDIPPMPTAAPRPPAPAAPPPAPAPAPAQPPAAATKYQANGLDPRGPTTNNWVTVYCRVWNSGRSGFTPAVLRVTKGGQPVRPDLPFSGGVGKAFAGYPMEFMYNDGCKVDSLPVVEGDYTAYLVENGQVVSEPVNFTVQGNNREFVVVWQQR